MPGELTPAEYYHSYLSSQRRVERWVVETGKELQVHAATHPPADVKTKKSPKKGVEEQVAELALPTPAPTNVANVVPVNERRKSREVTSKQPAAAHEADARTSRRHRSVGPSAKDRSHSRKVESRSRSRPSSGSKKTRAARNIGSATADRHRSQSKDARKSQRKHRQQQASSSLSTYLLYGVLPAVYALTGSSALLLLVAVVVCAGYIYFMESPSKSKSKTKPHT